ncbi:MAG: methionyl-tRNA formyltransferase [Chloroflexaceae bacterium]|nr:methionyl-tRNA formyltransferase [Chloroflexaceae bacterium]
MRIIYLGSPEFAISPLKALVQAGYEVVAAVTPPDRPAGRKQTLTPPPVKQAAQEMGIRVLQPESLRDPAEVEQLAALRPDIGVVAAYGKILRKAVLNIPPLGYLNLHPSLLPRHRGPAPVAGAILAGDSETGVTIMKLDPGMDSGPILTRVTVPLEPTARTGPLTEALFQLGAQALLEVLPRYASGQLEPQEQEHAQATVTRMLKKADGLVNWNHPAQHIERATRAYDPWPGMATIWRGQTVKLIAAWSHPEWCGNATPGTIVGKARGPLVATGAGALELLEVQPAGKRPMTGQEWFIGQREVVGQQFETPAPEQPGTHE